MVIQTAQKNVAAPKKRKAAPKAADVNWTAPSASVSSATGVFVLPASVEEPKRRGKKPSGQVIVTLRMDPEVRDNLQAEGPGWGARANSLLRKALGL